MQLTLLIIDIKAQVCDATMFNNSSKAGNTKNKSYNQKSSMCLIMLTASEFHFWNILVHREGNRGLILLSLSRVNREHFIHHAVFFSFKAGHPFIPVAVFCYFFRCLAGMHGRYLV